MSKINFRRLGLAAMTGAALALAGCATPFKADVARFQSQLPAPQGQSFTVEASNPALQGGIEFGQYANLVAGELTRFGYRPAANGERADLVVRMDYGVDKGRERVVSSPGFGDPWYGGYGGFYGRGFYRPVIVSGRGGIYGDTSPADFQESYLRHVFGFLGITDIEIVRAEGVAYSAQHREDALAAARASLPQPLREAA